MLSPSLASMMAHFILGGPDAAEVHFYHPSSVATSLQEVLEARGTGDWRLPIVGRAAFPIKYDYWFENTVRISPAEPATHFWGRVPLRLLTSFFREFAMTPADDLMVDIGTPVRTAGSGSSFDKTCARLLAASCTSAPKVGAAIIDLGINSTASPDGYGGNLRHAVTSNVNLSDHAEKVLSVLLERLDANGILSDAVVSCALMRPPSSWLKSGKSAFDQSCAPELLDAVNDLSALLARDSFPSVVNISLGTHVGPHNGDSPLEDAVATHLFRKDHCFVVAAAGNDGGKGQAMRREIKSKEREFVVLRTGPRCTELLVEFWWKETYGATTNLAIEADIVALQPRSALGSIKIAPGVAGSFLTAAPAGLPGHLVSQSLFAGKCRNDLSCIAFSLASTSSQSLPETEITFAIESDIDIILNGWIVLAEVEPRTGFIEGGQDGTIMVPASDSIVLGVAGCETSGQMWPHSSRGPAALYDTAGSSTASPLMAHLARLSGDAGTSYASPRAAADAATALANLPVGTSINSPIDLLCETYQLSRTALPPWDKRYGYLKQTC